MSEQKHTPGPWQWVGENLEGPQYTDVIESKVLCGRWCEGGTPRLVISDADRALIKSAPDLLEALQAIVAEADGPGKPFSGDSYLPAHLVLAARSAISRALGN